MRQTIAAVLALIKSLIDLAISIYLMYVIYKAFAGGSVWPVDFELAGGFWSGVAALFLSAVAVWVIDLVLGIVFTILVLPLVLLSVRDSKKHETH